jgi:hypothetical protein
VWQHPIDLPSSSICLFLSPMAGAGAAEIIYFNSRADLRAAIAQAVIGIGIARRFRGDSTEIFFFAENERKFHGNRPCHAAPCMRCWVSPAGGGGGLACDSESDSER